MGLDAVELLIEIEAAFGISLHDEDVSQVVTVGQLYESVCCSLSATDRLSCCLSAAAFYRVRQLLISVTGAERSHVRPRTDMQTLIPALRRKAAWRRMARSSDLRLPSLALPRWGVPLAIVLTALLISLAVFAVGWPLSLILVAPGLVVAVWMIDCLFGTVLRRRLELLGDLRKGCLPGITVQFPPKLPCTITTTYGNQYEGLSPNNSTSLWNVLQTMPVWWLI